MTDAIAALRTSHEHLRTVVSALTSAEIRQPAYPSEWSIAQVLSHLGSGAEISSLNIDAALTGGEGPARAAFEAVWAVWNAKTPDAQVHDGLAADAKLVAQLEELRTSSVRFQTWAGEVDTAGFAASRLSEHAVHTWDVEIAVAPGATLAPDAAAIIMAGLERLIGFAAKPAGWTGRIRVATTNPTDEFALELAETSTLTPWDGGESVAQVRLPAEAFVRLVYGRLDPKNTPAVHVDGISLEQLRSFFPGF